MLPKDLKKYFWEIDLEQQDLEKRPEFVIARILEYGDIEAIRWLFKFFGRGLIKKAILRHRGFSLRSANFWRVIFNLRKDKIVCLKNAYQKMQKTHWPY